MIRFVAALLILPAALTTFAQEPGQALWPSYAELLRRLEATEAQISYLRDRDNERDDSEIRQTQSLSAVPSVVEFAGHALPFEDEGCGSRLCGATPCYAGERPLGTASYESLSWKKGSWNIVPFGFLSGEVIGATSNTVSRPMVLYLLPNSPGDNRQLTVHGQTTALGFNFSGPRVGSFQVGGKVLFNFLGDRPALNQATPFFLRGYGELRNDDWRFTFGQQGDLFSPLDPVTVNFGGNKQAGNGGAFRGSLRAERFFRAIRSIGGWADVWHKLSPNLTAHLGYGVDDPRNADVGQFLDDTLTPVAGQRSRNRVIWANLICDVTEAFGVAIEVSQRETDYVAPSISNDAMIYHFRARLKF
jgi:hypothetical protein